MTADAAGDRRPASDLDAELLRGALRAGLPGFEGEVVVAATTRSTNDDARAAAAAGAPPLSTFVAEAQTAGRGRGGRAWHSPPGENLHLSFLIRPGWAPAASAPFALVVGLAVAEEIDHRLGATRAGVKWPNDVQVDGLKIAGVLLEASVQDGRMKSLVVGIGVDVHAASFPPELAQVATSLALLGAVDRDRTVLAAALVARVAAASVTFGVEGIAPFLPSLRARDALLGRPVRVEGRSGIARGIDDQGRLLLEDEGGLAPIVAGHVELA